MQIQKQYNWLLDKDFSEKNPIDATIVDLLQGVKDYELLVQCDLGLRKFSIYGDSINSLVDSFGSETDAWKNKKISILRVLDAKTGKNKRKITPIK